MSIAIQWHNPKQTAIHLELRRGWTWDELNDAIQEVDKLITSVEHTVHIIIDIRKAGSIPGDFMSMAGDIFANGEARANEGKRVVIGAGSLIRIAYNGILAVYRHKLANRPFLFASNLDEAYEMIGLSPS
jgi:hypothetical protein